MTSIKLMLTGAQAWASVDGPLTSGMVGIPVTIEYDGAWDGLTKNLVCRCSPWDSNDGEIRTILDVGENTVVAHEVMQPDMYLHLGVEGFNDDGSLVIPTTWARCGKIEYGANTCDDPSTDPELSVWNQLQTEMEQIRQDVVTPELVAEIKGYAQSAAQAASSAERAKDNATAASSAALSNAAAARNSADTAQTCADDAGASAGSAANLANGALQAQRAAEAAAQRAEAAADAMNRIDPASKTSDMTQPVGVDEDGRLWTAPTAGAGSGEESEAADILLGTLPMTISENNCYLLSDTNAAISTGEGAAQLLDFDANEPYIGLTTYNGGTVEKLGKNTVRIGFADVSKNAMAHFATTCEVGKTYTICAKLLAKSDDVTDGVPLIRIQKKNADTGAVNVAAQLVVPASGTMGFKTFEVTEETMIGDFQISFATTSGYTAGETYVTIALYLYEGEHTELPTGATFDIIAGEKYPTDGYMGATLSAVSGGPVRLYKVNTAGAEGETDEGGVIFFGDSILDFSDVAARYAAKTGKSVIDCSVGGTRMSASRESTSAYYPLDMANIADAIASGDFAAQLGSSAATAGFSTLASATIGNYKAMVLEFGANDFTAGVPFEGEDAASIAGAVRHILRTILTKYPNMRIVVLSTLQYVTLGAGTESGVPTHEDGTVWQMNEVIKGVCESDEFCVPWVDMYHAFGQSGITRNTLTSDGCHLTSPNGAKRYADILTAKLNGLGI